MVENEKLDKGNHIIQIKDLGYTVQTSGTSKQRSSI